ncbi:hypothetical protein FQA39_LY05251 [Lamprigera yunnana]|nr:hypothetical protein FQA39_LY05251 [Lamprigera yunnana]
MKIMIGVEVIYLFVAISCISAAKLPSYIQPCKASDPKLNECALKHGQEALPMFIKGDPKYKIPNLVPFKLPSIKFNTGSLQVDLSNAVINGLEVTEIKKVQIDLKNKHVSFVVSIANTNFFSNYEITGNILILPISGKGMTNITFVGGEYTYDFDYDFIDKQGDRYINIKSNKINFVTQRGYFHFDNLFGSDKQLGDQMNVFLNENWKDVQQELAPAITETISSIITTSLAGIFEKVPYKDIILQ